MPVTAPIHPQSERGPVPRLEPKDVADTILDEGELPLFTQHHNANGRPYIDSDLVEYHFEIPHRDAVRAVKLLNAHVDDEEIERAADEEWDG